MSTPAGHDQQHAQRDIEEDGRTYRSVFATEAVHHRLHELPGDDATAEQPCHPADDVRSSCRQQGDGEHGGVQREGCRDRRSPQDELRAPAPRPPDAQGPAGKALFSQSHHATQPVAPQRGQSEPLQPRNHCPDSGR